LSERQGLLCGRTPESSVRGNGPLSVLYRAATSPAEELLRANESRLRPAPVADCSCQAPGNDTGQLSPNETLAGCRGQQHTLAHPRVVQDSSRLTRLRPARVASSIH
jgi:hypothetical protein